MLQAAKLNGPALELSILGLDLSKDKIIRGAKGQGGIGSLEVTMAGVTRHREGR